MNELEIPIQDKHPGRTRQAAIFEKIQKLRENFKRLDETKPKNRKGEQGKRKFKDKTRDKRGKLFQSRDKRKKFSQGGKTKKVTRYYLEDGKYEENENFEDWADKLRRMWKKVDVPPKSRQIFSCVHIS